MYPGEEFLVRKNPIREKFMISWEYIYPCLGMRYNLQVTLCMNRYGLLKNAYWSSVLDTYGLFKKWEMVRRMSY